MIGILLITHGDAGKELIKSSELIIGHQDKVGSLSLNHGDDIEELKSEVENRIRELDEGEGVLALVDLLGGSPSNVTSRMIQGVANLECITGVNMPMLIEAICSRDHLDLKHLAVACIESSMNGIKDLRELIFSNSSS